MYVQDVGWVEMEDYVSG